jgi:hypothetical protein
MLEEFFVLGIRQPRKENEKEEERKNGKQKFQRRSVHAYSPA